MCYLDLVRYERRNLREEIEKVVSKLGWKYEVFKS